MPTTCPYSTIIRPDIEQIAKLESNKIKPT